MHVTLSNIFLSRMVIFNFLSSISIRKYARPNFYTKLGNMMFEHPIEQLKFFRFPCFLLNSGTSQSSRVSAPSGVRTLCICSRLRAFECHALVQEIMWKVCFRQAPLEVFSLWRANRGCFFPSCPLPPPPPPYATTPSVFTAAPRRRTDPPKIIIPLRFPLDDWRAGLTDVIFGRRERHSAVRTAARLL